MCLQPIVLLWESQKCVLITATSKLSKRHLPQKCEKRPHGNSETPTGKVCWSSTVEDLHDISSLLDQLRHTLSIGWHFHSDSQASAQISNPNLDQAYLPGTGDTVIHEAVPPV